MYRLFLRLFFLFVTLTCLFAEICSSYAFGDTPELKIKPKQKTVKVSDVNTFFKSIDSNTIIILAPGDYHLDQVDTNIKNTYCNWAMVLLDEIYYDEEIDEDKTLLISNINNLTIKSSGKKDEPVRILTNRRSATVLAFKNCENIIIDNIVLGHDVVKYLDPGDVWASYCSGEVTEFFDCKNVCISNAVLFGSGTRGFLAHRCNIFKLINSTIKECSWGAFGIFNSENIVISKSKIINNGYRSLIDIENSSDITISHSLFSGNYRCDEYSGAPVSATMFNNIKIESLVIELNDFAPDDLLLPLKTND